MTVFIRFVVRSIVIYLHYMLLTHSVSASPQCVGLCTVWPPWCHTDYNSIYSSSELQTRTVQRRTFPVASFPNVIGCIDWTHVSMIAPSVNEHEFVNRHTHRGTKRPAKWPIPVLTSSVSRGSVYKYTRQRGSNVNNLKFQLQTNILSTHVTSILPSAVSR